MAVTSHCIRRQFSQTEHFHTPRLTRALSGLVMRRKFKILLFAIAIFTAGLIVYWNQFSEPLAPPHQASLSPIEAAAEIRRLGGDTEAGEKIVLAGMFGPNFTNEKFELLEPLVDLRMLSVIDSPATDSAFSHCKHLQNVDYVSLESCSLSGECFRHLTNNTNLKTLFIEDSPITNDGLGEILNFTKLERLSLDFWDVPSQITTIEIGKISQLNNLKQFYITMKNVPDGLEESLRSAMPNCDVNISEYSCR